MPETLPHAALPAAMWCAYSTREVATAARRKSTPGPGLVWSMAWACGGAELGLDGNNVNELTSQLLTDMGGGPTFYDCAVQVEKSTP